MKIVINLVLAVVAVVLAVLLYMEIQRPIEFNKEKEIRYAKVIERLKDIRKAEFAYKAVRNQYADSFEKLTDFIMTDSFPVIKKIGDIEDSVAVAMGQVVRDTSMVSVRDSLFPPDYHVDSLGLVPYTKGKPFKINAGEIDVNGLTVKVFEVIDGAPFDPNQVLKVGSMEEPSTNGNWE
ncbi:MAG: hypothetical protein H6585_10885 [Flavobacteriales bacterium]|nr:hypothetical protein [Flavobacteriales bacterium]MCB9448838.1 hypothetical protein [Flavobacteriales bacterium]